MKIYKGRQAERSHVPGNRIHNIQECTACDHLSDAAKKHYLICKNGMSVYAWTPFSTVKISQNSRKKSKSPNRDYLQVAGKQVARFENTDPKSLPQPAPTDSRVQA